MPFEAGQSGNPSGRPPLTPEQRKQNEAIRSAFKKLSRKSLKILRDDFINNPVCNKELRLKAIGIILKHAFANGAVLSEMFDEPLDGTLNVIIETRRNRIGEEESEDDFYEQNGNTDHQTDD